MKELRARTVEGIWRYANSLWQSEYGRRCPFRETEDPIPMADVLYQQLLAAVSAGRYETNSGQSIVLPTNISFSSLADNIFRVVSPIGTFCNSFCAKTNEYTTGSDIDMVKLINGMTRLERYRLQLVVMLDNLDNYVSVLSDYIHGDVTPDDRLIQRSSTLCLAVLLGLDEAIETACDTIVKHRECAHEVFYLTVPDGSELFDKIAEDAFAEAEAGDACEGCKARDDGEDDFETDEDEVSSAFSNHMAVELFKLPSVERCKIFTVAENRDFIKRAALDDRCRGLADMLLIARDDVVLNTRLNLIDLEAKVSENAKAT